MKRFTAFAAAVIMSGVLTGAAYAADSPRLGEVRTFAVARGNQDAITQLHHDGWLEANGRVLSAAQFPALYREIGRTWTARAVSEGSFAIPLLRDTTQLARSFDNPYGVLGPGDLVTSGRVHPVVDRSYPLTYWIFVGQDVSQLIVESR